MYAHIYVNVHLCLRYSRPQRFKAFKNISNATHTLRAEFPPPKTNGPKTHRPSEVPATTECSGFGPKEAKGSWVVKVGEDRCCQETLQFLFFQNALLETI